jgi:uncharacterized protein YoxC
MRCAVLTEAEEQLVATLLRSLDQTDKTSRTLTNATLQLVAKVNALTDDAKAKGEAMDLLARTVDRHARAGEAIARELQQVRGDLTALAEIHTRLAGVETQEAAQGERLDALEAQGNEAAAAMREMAQVVVGSGEATGQAIATVQRLAHEGREAAREASQVVKTLAAGGEAIPRHPVAQAIGAFRTLDADARRTLARLVVAAIAGAVVLGVLGFYVYLKIKGVKPA